MAVSGAIGFFGGMYLTEWLRPSLGRLCAFLLGFPLIGSLSFGLLYGPAALGAVRRLERGQQSAFEKPLIGWGMFGIFLSAVLSLLLAAGVAMYAIWTVGTSQMRDSM